MPDSHPILLAGARGFCQRLGFFVHSGRADQPHHPQRRRAARLSSGRCSSASAPRRWRRFTAPLRSPAFPRFFDNRIVKAFMEVFSFVFHAVSRRQISDGANPSMCRPSWTPPRKKSRARIDEKFHPHSAFMTGFVRVLGNLGVLLSWIVLAANLMSHELFHLTSGWTTPSPPRPHALAASRWARTPGFCA